jgi:hypothetical protein
MTPATPKTEILLLRGSSLLDAETLHPIATLGEDGVWRTPEGAVTDSIAVPRQAATAIVKPAEQLAAEKAQDATWVAGQLERVAELAHSQRDLTVDDCRAVLTARPYKSSLMSSLMVAAAHRGLIEKTSDHRRTSRATSGGRSVRVWRSRVYTG